MSKKYVLEITPQKCYRHFEKYGHHSTHFESLWTKEAEKISLLIFTGGNDVNPQLYGEKRGKNTEHPNTYRDEHEQKCFNRAKELGIPMLGICRGSQFLCVMSGGKLIQDIRGHCCYHTIKTHKNKIIECNSTHHQMQLPPDDAVVLAVSDPKLSNSYLNGDNEQVKVEKEIEVVYYPKSNAMGIQYHPEWLESHEDCVVYAQQVVKEFLKFKE